MIQQLVMYEEELAQINHVCEVLHRDANARAVLVIDKNVANLSKIADRHYIIERGRTVWTGTSEQLIAEPDLQHRYLGI